MSTKPKKGAAAPEQDFLPSDTAGFDPTDDDGMDPFGDDGDAFEDDVMLSNPLDNLDIPEGASNEEAAQAMTNAVNEQFKAIHDGRRQQQEAVQLANEPEYWFAVYFQTREQKETFLRLAKWIAHGDKYLDGQWVAKKMGFELPPRPSKYKVGRLDSKLTDLT